MSDKVTRRDFIDGFACAIVAGSSLPASGDDEVASDYPPALTGMRGSRNEDLATAHRLRDGARFALDDYPASEEVDCAVLYGRPFSDFENALRDEVTRVVGSSGFDAERDIGAITVNRWGHGYSYDLDSLSDPDRTESSLRAGRAPIGRISVAGSDAAWDAYAHAAIDQGRRAAHEAIHTLKR